MRPAVNTERDKQIVRRVNAGETYQDIGQSYSITKARVQQIAALNGIVKGHTIRIPDEKRKEILRRIEDRAQRYYVIARDVGCSPSMVAKIAVNYGLRRFASAEQADALREIALEGRLAGLSAQEIANRTGMTRNAVIGYWFRLRKEGRL